MPKIFACGTNGNCQAGFPKETPNVFQLTPIAELSQKIPAQIAGGLRHTVLLTTDDEFWVWGENEDAQLGLEKTSKDQTPIKNEKLSGKGIVHVAAGGFHTMVVTSQTIYSFGYNNEGQVGSGSSDTKVLMAEIPPTAFSPTFKVNSISKISMGARHTVIIATDSSSGEPVLYGIGRNSDGQLALGENNKSTKVPTRITFFEDRHLRIRKVKSGGYFTLFMTSDSDVYFSGTTGEKAIHVPVLLKVPIGVPTSISSGYSTAFIITNRDEVYTFARNDVPLGLDDAIHVNPTLAPALSGKGIKKLYTGYGYTVAKTHGNRYWSVGKNESGELGHKVSNTFSEMELTDIQGKDCCVVTEYGTTIIGIRRDLKTVFANKLEAITSGNKGLVDVLGYADMRFYYQ